MLKKWIGMYGWRARLGLLVPATNSVMEPEFNKMAQQLDGVSVHASRMPTPKEPLSVDLELKFSSLAMVEKAAREVAQVGVSAISFGSTGGSFVEGIQHDLSIIKKIEEATGIPAVTPSTSVISALKHLGIEKVGVTTPYPRDLNERLKVFLKEQGFTVVDFREHPTSEVLKIGRYPPEVAYSIAREISDEADGIFISCTDFRTIEIIEMLERDTDKPVVTSNQATMFRLLNTVRIKDSIRGYGRLLEKR